MVSLLVIYSVFVRLLVCMYRTTCVQLIRSYEVRTRQLVEKLFTYRQCLPCSRRRGKAIVMTPRRGHDGQLEARRPAESIVTDGKNDIAPASGDMPHGVVIVEVDLRAMGRNAVRSTDSCSFPSRYRSILTLQPSTGQHSEI